MTIKLPAFKWDHKTCAQKFRIAANNNGLDLFAKKFKHNFLLEKEVVAPNTVIEHIGHVVEERF